MIIIIIIIIIIINSNENWAHFTTGFASVILYLESENPKIENLTI